MRFLTWIPAFAGMTDMERPEVFPPPAHFLLLNPVWSVDPSSRSVRQNASSRAAVERIAPQRLHRVAGAVQGHVRRGTLARGDPGALVAVLRAAAVQPAAVRKLVGGRLADLMPDDDGDACIGAETVEVGPAARPGIGDVRRIGVSHVTAH